MDHSILTHHLSKNLFNHYLNYISLIALHWGWRIFCWVPHKYNFLLLLGWWWWWWWLLLLLLLLLFLVVVVQNDIFLILYWFWIYLNSYTHIYMLWRSVQKVIYLKAFWELKSFAQMNHYRACNWSVDLQICTRKLLTCAFMATNLKLQLQNKIEIVYKDHTFSQCMYMQKCCNISVAQYTILKTLQYPQHLWMGK